MSIAVAPTTQYLWFGTRAVRFESGGNTGPQFEVIDDASDFATRTLPANTVAGYTGTGPATVDFTGAEWQQFLAFSATQAQIDAFNAVTVSTADNINLADGIDTAAVGQVNSTGDLRVGAGITAHNIADVAGNGRLVDTSNTLEAVDDPVTITGLGKANLAILDAASIDAADVGNRVVFTNDIGFGLINAMGAENPNNAGRLNDGDSINIGVNGDKQLSQASFTVKVLGGGSARVIIDSDGATIRDTNGGTSGGFVQDDSAGELDLGMLTHGTKVTINYVNETIWINGQALVANLGDVVAFFDAFQAAGSDDLTLGSVIGSTIGWSADDLVLATDLAPVGAPVAPVANGVISFRYTAPGSNTAADLEATLDLGDNGSVDAFETLATSFGGGGILTGDADGDANPAELKGTNTPFDILRLVTIGVDDANAPQGQQVGVLDRSLGMGIDTGKEGANLSDGSSLGGNYGDLSGGDYLENGEFIRFDLGANFDGIAAEVVISASGLQTRDGADAVVRLLNDAGGLVEQFALDLDAGLTWNLNDSVFAAFDKVEIEAVAGARFAVADVNIDVLAAFSAGAADSFDRIQLDVGNHGVNERADIAGDGLGFVNTGANPELPNSPEGVAIGDIFTYFTLDGDPTDVRWRKPEGLYSTGDGDNNRDIDGPNGAVTIALKTGASLPPDLDGNLTNDQVAFAYGGSIGFTAFGNGEQVRFEFSYGGNEFLEVVLANTTGSDITNVVLDDLTGYDGQIFDSLRISAVASTDQVNLQDITFNVFAL